VSAPIFYGPNRLRTSTVSAASTVSGRPITRLSDGFAQPLWEGTGPIVWDQGATPLSFDAVLGTAGHNLAGAVLVVETAADALFTSPTILGTLGIFDAAAFRIFCSGTVLRYSRLRITGGPATVQLAELWAAPAVVMPQAPLLATSANDRPNVVGQETEAGGWVGYIRSAARWEAEWVIPMITRDQRDVWRDFYRAIGGDGPPFFLYDDEATLRWVQCLSAKWTGMLPQQYELTVQLREVLS